MLLDTKESPQSDNWWNIAQCKLWQPKEKEWVVCIVSSIKNMFIVFQYEEEDSYNDIKDMNPDDIVTIQPFIGELPSFLKENR